MHARHDAKSDRPGLRDGRACGELGGTVLAPEIGRAAGHRLGPARTFHHRSRQVDVAGGGSEGQIKFLRNTTHHCRRVPDAGGESRHQTGR